MMKKLEIKNKVKRAVKKMLIDTHHDLLNYSWKKFFLLFIPIYLILMESSVLTHWSILYEFANEMFLTFSMLAVTKAMLITVEKERKNKSESDSI